MEPMLVTRERFYFYLADVYVQKWCKVNLGEGYL